MTYFFLNNKMPVQVYDEPEYYEYGIIQLTDFAHNFITSYLFLILEICCGLDSWRITDVVIWQLGQKTSNVKATPAELNH